MTTRADIVRELRLALMQGRETDADRAARVATGHPSLDHALGGGFIRGALNEVMLERPGSGAFEALIGFARDLPRIAFVHPVRLPYPPALVHLGIDANHCLIVRARSQREHLWALERVLEEGDGAAVISWLGDEVDDRTLRRLQLAARKGKTTALTFRPARAARHASPAPIRLCIRPHPTSSAHRRLELEFLKCPERPFLPPLIVEWSHDALDESPTCRTPPGASFAWTPGRDRDRAGARGA